MTNRTDCFGYVLRGGLECYALTERKCEGCKFYKSAAPYIRKRLNEPSMLGRAREQQLYEQNRLRRIAQKAGIILSSVIMALTPIRAKAQPLEGYEVEQICYVVSNYYPVEQDLLQAMAWVESGYETEARNGSCIGLMQINPHYFQDKMDILGADDPMVPYVNVLLAGWWLWELQQMYSLEDTLSIYNCGSPGKCGGYVSKVKAEMDRLKAERSENEAIERGDDTQ